jgi:3-deoxy-D-manno-octulosonate 8-phosphate phosphatase (KDO 8-P phosphatase)
MTAAPGLRERCLAVELLVLDVDGVLTDGSIVYGDAGTELKAFHVRDGSGLKVWRACGMRTALITGRRSVAVEKRAAELGIEFVVQGAGDKLAGLRDVLSRGNVSPEKIAYVGDDLPDLPPMVRCGLAVAVADACTEVRAAAHYVTQMPGGRGAVREVVELILRCRGAWQDEVKRLRNGNSEEQTH